MNLHRIEAFLAVAQSGKISRAATQLEVAQSVLSRHIAGLEAELGVRLFERTGRGVSMTEAGQHLAPRLRAALADMQRAAAEAAEVGGQPGGVVRVGMVPAAAQPLVGMLYRQVAQQHPRIRLQFVDGFSHALDERLASGDLDLAVINRFGRLDPQGEERLCVVDSLVIGPPGAFTADAPPVPFRQMAALPLVLASRPNGLRNALDQMCRRAGVQLRVEVEADSMLTMKDLVFRGGLYSVLPYQLVHEELAAGRVSCAPIVRPTVPRVLTLAMSSRQPASAAIRAVAHAIRQIVQAELVPTVWR